MFDIASFKAYLKAQSIPQDFIAKTVEEFMLPHQPAFAGFTVLNREEFSKAKKNPRIVQAVKISDTDHSIVFLRTIHKDRKALGSCPVVPLNTWSDLKQWVDQL